MIKRPQQIDTIYGEMSVVAKEFRFAPHLRDFGFQFSLKFERDIRCHQGIEHGAPRQIPGKIGKTAQATSLLKGYAIPPVITWRTLPRRPAA